MNGNGRYIILIRHGEREHRLPKTDDFLEPLTKQGKRETCRLRVKLAYSGFQPAVYFTSTYRHARQAAGLLAKGAAPVIKLRSLEPGGRMDKLKKIINEARRVINDVEQREVIAFVGHEPSLSQLLTRLTSKRFRPLNRAEAVCVEGESWDDFLRGNAKVCTRIPIVDYQEEQLRSKISSKLSVATFLAGFTFAALIEVLIANPTNTPPLFQKVTHTIAIVCLTAAAALFIAAAYMYDQLGMPEGFWAYGDRPTRRRAWFKEFEKNLHYHGPLYAHMLWVWSYVFTPAVFITVLGFLAILVKTADPYVIALGSAVVVIVGVYYSKTRPRLGSD